MPVFRTQQQIRYRVLVPIHERRAGGMPREDSLSQGAHLFQYDIAVSRFAVAPPVGIFRVHKNIQSAVTVPISHGHLAPSAAAYAFGI